MGEVGRIRLLYPLPLHTKVRAYLAAHAHAGRRVGSGIQQAGVAFDPLDLARDAGEAARIGGKMPRLTIMEEGLLLGIKVQFPPFPWPLNPFNIDLNQMIDRRVRRFWMRR